MKWYKSSDFRPKHGTNIFIWDLKDQKEMMLYVGWDDDQWKYQTNFPYWKYVLDGIKPVVLPEGPNEGR